jgi:Holliday junction resolvase
MATPESVTKAKVKALLTGPGIWHFFPAANGYGRAGIGDVVACVNGHFLMVECKADKGKITALQERELQRVRDAGGQALVVYDTPEDLEVLKTTIHALQLKGTH